MYRLKDISDMAQQWRGPAALLVDLDLVPSTHMVGHSHLLTPVPGDMMPSLTFTGTMCI